MALGFGPGLDLSGRFRMRPLSFAERIEGVLVKPEELDEDEVGDDEDEVGEKEDRRGSSATGSDSMECRSIESKSRCP